jgi:hypothetical protein
MSRCPSWCAAFEVRRAAYGLWGVAEVAKRDRILQLSVQQRLLTSTSASAEEYQVRTAVGLFCFQE